MNIEFTEGPGDARRLAASGTGMDAVVAVGGDGTVRDVADGVWGTQTVMGVVPTGSGNGLARSLGIPMDLHEALATALAGNWVDIDRGVANGCSFYSAFGVGVDAEISYRFAHDRRRGRTTYIKHAIRQMFSYPPSRFVIRGSRGMAETEALLIAVCNCMQYGNNAYISPKADPRDGLLDVTVVHQGTFLAKVKAGLDLFSGMLDHNVLVEAFRSGALEIEREGVEKCIVHLDGEPAEMLSKISIRCERGGLRVAVPVGSRTFKPVLTPLKAMWEDMLADIRKNLGELEVK